MTSSPSQPQSPEWLTNRQAVKLHHRKGASSSKRKAPLCSMELNGEEMGWGFEGWRQWLQEMEEIFMRANQVLPLGLSSLGFQDMELETEFREYVIRTMVDHYRAPLLCGAGFVASLQCLAALALFCTSFAQELKSDEFQMLIASGMDGLMLSVVFYIFWCPWSKGSKKRIARGFLAFSYGGMVMQIWQQASPLKTMERIRIENLILVVLVSHVGMRSVIKHFVMVLLICNAATLFCFVQPDKYPGRDPYSVLASGIALSCLGIWLGSKLALHRRYHWYRRIQTRTPRQNLNCSDEAFHGAGEVESCQVSSGSKMHGPLQTIMEADSDKDCD